MKFKLKYKYVWHKGTHEDMYLHADGMSSADGQVVLVKNEENKFYTTVVAVIHLAPGEWIGIAEEM